MFKMNENSRSVAILMSFYETTNDAKLEIVKACDAIAKPMCGDSFKKLYTAMGVKRGTKVISDKFWYIMYFESEKQQWENVKEALKVVENAGVKIDDDEIGTSFLQMVEFTGASLEEVCAQEIKNKLEDDKRFLL